jgi:DNA topoisomerase-1
MSTRTGKTFRIASDQPVSHRISPRLARGLDHADRAQPIESAKQAGLRYVSDTSPGITRKKHGSGFIYVRPDGKVVRDADELLRFRQLAIPPAWTNVWICPVPSGHIQAIGRDARGRKQYRYHPKWREQRDESKYGRMLSFVQALPRIRKTVARDMKRPGLSREKVLATVLRLMETTLIRVGNDEYAKQNNSYGLTTLRDKHADVCGCGVRFRFRGKSGISHDIGVSDCRLAKIVKECQELPGQELLQYVDEKGDVRDVRSEDVNAYLKEISGEDFTAKDFRTWAGTVLAAQALREFERVDSQAAAKKNIVRAVESVAKKLGNTRAVCRKCYIHPGVIDSYMDGQLLENLSEGAAKLIKGVSGLRPEEAAVVVLLQKRLGEQRRKLKRPTAGKREPAAAVRRPGQRAASSWKAA